MSYRFERKLVADPFDEHDRACLDGSGQRACWRAKRWGTSAASGQVDSWRRESLLIVHLLSLSAHRPDHLLDLPSSVPLPLGSPSPPWIHWRL
jgi:hypothetical protein